MVHVQLNRPGLAGCAGASIADYWISVEVQSRSTAVIPSTVVAVSPADMFGWLLNNKVSISANDIHSNHMIHIYNFILATRAIIIIFTHETTNQVADGHRVQPCTSGKGRG